MRAAAFVAALAAGGCGGTEACADFSAGVLVVVRRTDDGRTARLEVELLRSDEGEGSIPVKLCAGDTLEVDGVRVTGVKRSNGATVYEVTQDGVSGSASVTHRVAFNGGELELSGTVDVPGFGVSTPASGAEMARGGDLRVRWMPASGEGTIDLRIADTVDGDACLVGATLLTVTDDGEEILPAGTLVGAAVDAVCEAAVIVSRRTTATLTPTRGDGEVHPDSRIEATTSRMRGFVSVP